MLESVRACQRRANCTVRSCLFLPIAMLAASIAGWGSRATNHTLRPGVNLAHSPKPVVQVQGAAEDRPEMALKTRLELMSHAAKKLRKGGVRVGDYEGLLGCTSAVWVT